MASRTLNSPAWPETRVQSDMRQMRQPFAVSAAFHLALLLFAIFGLHLLPKKEMDIPTPISVSMVKPSDIARTTHVDEAHEAKEEPTEPKQSKAPEPPKEAQSSAPPPPPPVEQPVQQTPPPPTKPAEPLPTEPMAKPLPKLAPVQQAQSTFQQPAQLPPLQKPLPVAKPAPQPPKPQQAKTKQMDQDFQSLLTNLAPPVPKADQISKDKPVKSHAPSAARADLSNQMTADEMALVRERLKQCWIVPAGSYDAEHLIIPIQAKYGEDKMLLSETLIDTDNRYNRDPTYRAAADSALRALRNPQCNPLPWPDGKYEDWKEKIIDFNPKMLSE